MAKAALIVLAATATLAGAQRAVGADPGPLSLLITPAVIDADAEGPGPLPSIAVTNRSNLAFRLAVAPAIATQAVEGGLEPRRGARNDALARRILRVTAPRIVRPHSSVEIESAFRTFAGRSSLTLTAAITATPLRPPPGAIRFRFVLLPAIFIHRPKVPAARAVILRVRAKRVQRRLELSAFVQNRGLRPALVTAVKFRILDRNRTIATASAPTGYVAPRSSRYFRAQLSHRVPPRTLRAEAIIRYGTRETRRSGFFRPAPA